MDRIRGARGLAACIALLGCGSGGGDACLPGDLDGVVGGDDMFVVTVDDKAFAPAVVEAQNLAKVTLVLKNAGTKPHDLVFACLATPNSLGCPTSSCFPPAASLASVAPGASAMTSFTTPNPEGIYSFRSDLSGDAQTGQFVVQ